MKRTLSALCAPFTTPSISKHRIRSEASDRILAPPQDSAGVPKRHAALRRYVFRSAPRLFSRKFPPLFCIAAARSVRQSGIYPYAHQDLPRGTEVCVQPPTAPPCSRQVSRGIPRLRRSVPVVCPTPCDIQPRIDISGFAVQLLRSAPCLAAYSPASTFPASQFGFHGQPCAMPERKPDNYFLTICKKHAILRMTMGTASAAACDGV